MLRLSESVSDGLATGLDRGPPPLRRPRGGAGQRPAAVSGKGMERFRAKRKCSIASRRQVGVPVSYTQARMPACAQVAQLVEQRTENPRVGGSIPPLGTGTSRRRRRTDIATGRGEGRTMTPQSMSYVSGASEQPLLGLTIGAQLDRTAARFPDNEALVVHIRTCAGAMARSRRRSTNSPAGLLALGLEPASASASGRPTTANGR